MGSTLKEKCNDIEDSGAKEYKEHSYKLFQLRDYKVRASNGEFRCPFCACKDEDDYEYTHLLQHAIRVAEGSINGKQRAKHAAMARYLAVDLVDLADEAKAEDQQVSDEDWVAPAARNDQRIILQARLFVRLQKKQPRANVNAQKVAMAEKREKEALDKISELERKMNEMTDEINALIAKERSSNDELQGVRKELMKGLSDIERSNQIDIGIKRIGELDPDVFITELAIGMPPGEIVVTGVELCTLWQEKIKDPHWYPFQIFEDETGKPRRVLKQDDITLQSLKEEWGEEIHDAVVEALTDLQEHNPSGCYMVPELWNFREKRKAKLDEVIHGIFELQMVRGHKPCTQPRKTRNSKGGDPC